MKDKDFSNDHSVSRLDRFKHSHEGGSGGYIAGRKVSQDETTREEKNDIVKTSIKIPRKLKEQSQALAALKQMTWTALIEKGLENQLKANADLMNQFTKYHIDANNFNDN